MDRGLDHHGPDPRAEGKHTLILDTFVPVDLASGEDWEQIGPAYVRNTLLEQLRNYTVNMDDDNILAEYVETGPSLARANLCFYRGVTTGGERTLGADGGVPAVSELCRLSRAHQEVLHDRAVVSSGRGYLRYGDYCRKRDPAGFGIERGR